MDVSEESGDSDKGEDRSLCMVWPVTQERRLCIFLPRVCVCVCGGGGGGGLKTTSSWLL